MGFEIKFSFSFLILFVLSRYYFNFFWLRFSSQILPVSFSSQILRPKKLGEKSTPRIFGKKIEKRKYSKQNRDQIHKTQYISVCVSPVVGKWVNKCILAMKNFLKGWFCECFKRMLSRFYPQFFLVSCLFRKFLDIGFRP